MTIRQVAVAIGPQGPQGPPASYGPLGSRPLAAGQVDGALYLATNVLGGTWYQVQSGAWVAVSIGTSGITGAQMDPAAGITGSQLAASAGIVASQLSSQAATSGQTVIANGSGGFTLGNATAAAHAAAHQPGGSDDIMFHGGKLSPNRLETFPRINIISTSSSMATGTVYLATFQFDYAITATRFRFFTGTATTPSGLTKARMGLYTIDGSKNCTLVAASADFSGTVTATSLALTPALAVAGDLSTTQTTYAMTAGQLYGMAVIFVGTTPPTSFAQSGFAGGLDAITPFLGAAVSGQTDLPSSITSTTIGSSGTTKIFWMGIANASG